MQDAPILLLDGGGGLIGRTRARCTVKYAILVAGSTRPCQVQPFSYWRGWLAG